MAIEIKGNWDKGFALDLHTLSCECTGHDEHGQPQFKTVRSEIGQLLYTLKYKSDSSVIPSITEKIKKSITGIDKFHFLISVPLSKKDRVFQPVVLVCQALSTEFNIPYLQDAVIKTKTTEELKTIQDPKQRKAILENAISFNNKYNMINKNILLIDDLYRSGSTLSVVTDVLYKIGKANKVCVLTLTKTRVNK